MSGVKSMGGGKGVVPFVLFTVTVGRGGSLGIPVGVKYVDTNIGAYIGIQVNTSSRNVVHGTC